MQKYEGTLVFVAHDQTMLDDVATAVLELKGPGQHDYFPGGYAEFLEKTGRSAKAVGAR